MVRLWKILILFLFMGTHSWATHLVPSYAIKKQENTLFSSHEKRMIEGAKGYLVEEITHFQDNLTEKFHCFSRFRVCPQGPGYFESKLSQLIRANRQFRLLVGAYKNWGTYQKNYKVHFLSKNTFKALKLKKLKYTQKELEQLNSLFYTNKRQILNDWISKGLHQKEYKGYHPPREISNHKVDLAYIEKLYAFPGFQDYMHEKMDELRSYYLNQIMALLAAEPLILFIEQSTITPHIIAKAYQKYILLLEERVLHIENTKKDRDLQKIALLYDSLLYNSNPSEFNDFYNSRDGVFAKLSSWNAMINKIKHNMILGERRDQIINNTFLAVGVYATFIPSTAIFKFSLGLSYFLKSGVDTYFTLGDYKINIMDWLSGLQTFDRVNKSRSAYLSNLFMSFFLAQPVVSTLAKGSQLIKLQLEVTDGLIQNIRNYINNKTKTQVKTEVSHSNVNDQFNDKNIYIETNEDQVLYVSSYIADYDDFTYFKYILGCLALGDKECKKPINL